MRIIDEWIFVYSVVFILIFYILLVCLLHFLAIARSDHWKLERHEKNIQEVEVSLKFLLEIVFFLF